MNVLHNISTYSLVIFCWPDVIKLLNMFMWLFKHVRDVFCLLVYVRYSPNRLVLLCCLLRVLSSTDFTSRQASPRSLPAALRSRSDKLKCVLLEFFHSSGENLEYNWFLKIVYWRISIIQDIVVIITVILHISVKRPPDAKGACLKILVSFCIIVVSMESWMSGVHV